MPLVATEVVYAVVLSELVGLGVVGSSEGNDSTCGATLAESWASVPTEGDFEVTHGRTTENKIPALGSIRKEPASDTPAKINW